MKSSLKKQKMLAFAQSLIVKFGGSPDASVDIEFDLNLCLGTATKIGCWEHCGSFLSEPPDTIDQYSSISFKLEYAVTPPNSQACTNLSLILDGNCTYEYVDGTEGTFPLWMIWEYESDGI